MAAAPGLGPEVGFVVVVGGEGVGHPLFHRDATMFQRRHLARVIGEQPHTGKPQVAKHLGGGRKNPLIGFEAKLFVGLEGIETPILEMIGAELVDEPDAPAFLGQKATRRRRFRRWR